MWNKSTFIVTLNIGHNVGAETVWSDLDIINACVECLGIDALTHDACTGVYNGMVEPSSRITIYTTEPDVIVALVPALAHNLEQECIACTVAPTDTAFIPTL